MVGFQSKGLLKGRTSSLGPLPPAGRQSLGLRTRRNKSNRLIFLSLKNIIDQAHGVLALTSQLPLLVPPQGP
jgi:hypothetical protein